MRTLIVGLCLITPSAASSAQSRGGDALLFSPKISGSEISCATALRQNDHFDDDLRWWAMGYWSGQNGAGLAFVGSQTDTNGIIAEIEKLCRDRPSMLFIGAVGKTYVDMKKQGR